MNLLFVQYELNFVVVTTDKFRNAWQQLNRQCGKTVKELKHQLGEQVCYKQVYMYTYMLCMFKYSTSIVCIHTLVNLSSNIPKEKLVGLWRLYKGYAKDFHPQGSGVSSLISRAIIELISALVFL